MSESFDKKLSSRAAAPFLFFESIPYALLLWSAFRVFSNTVDDPFITFRYAANVLAGHGPVYNIGQHVEADTSPLHLLVCVFLMLIPTTAGMMFKAKLFSLLMGCLTLWQTAVLGKRLGLPYSGIKFCQFLLIVNGNFAISSTNALETTLFAFLLTAGVSAYVDELTEKRGLASAIWLFFALLARPETALIFVFLLAARAVYAYREKISSRYIAGWALAFVIPAMAMLTARYAYYRSFLPSTYYAKLETFHPALGLHYLFLMPVKYWPLHSVVNLAGLASAIFWALLLIGICHSRRDWRFAALSIVFAAECIAVMRADGDWMPGWRFMVPVLPFAVILQYLGLCRLMEWLTVRLPSGTKRTQWVTAASAGLGLLWFVVFLSGPANSWTRCGYATDDKGLLRVGFMCGPTWIDAATIIHRQFPSGSLICYSEIGYAGYTNLDKKFFDVRGLIDPEVSRLYPSSYKCGYGVVDNLWYLPTSPLYSLLRQQHPAAIISFDFATTPPKEVLGEYQLSEVTTDGGIYRFIYLPKTNDGQQAKH